MPQVSVIIPLYNKSKYIARTLDSVFAQTFQDYEVVVVDDGSTDEGPAIVERYKDPRLRLIWQANAGPGAARNRGIRGSSAPLLSFLDADDEWLPGFLEKSIGLLRQHPYCDLSVSGCYLGINRRIRYRPEKFKEGIWEFSSRLSAKEFQSTAELFNSWTIVCKREVVERFGGFYEKDKCTWCEDRYLWIQVQLNCRVYMNPEPLVWWHNEASDLQCNKTSTHPIPPMLMDPEPIRNNCPAEYRQQLEQWFAYRAMKEAWRLVRLGNISDARFWLHRFEPVRALGLKYRGVQLDILFASVCNGATPVYRIAHSFWKLRNRLRRRKDFAKRQEGL